MVKQKLNNNQQGFVAITVALFIIALVTIITVSFAFLIRREQKQALDRQLSTQAYYAAESGVNDAIVKIKSDLAANVNTSMTSCTDVSQLTPSIDANTQTKYTCVLVDQDPDSLIYDNREKNESKVVRVRSASPITWITISWEDADKDTVFANSGTHFYLPEKKLIDDPSISGSLDQNADFPNHTGMVRATITPANAADTTDNLLHKSQTLFLYPNGGATGYTLGKNQINFRTTGNQDQEGVFADGSCNSGNNDANSTTPRFCNVAINVSALNTNDFYLRLRPLYKKVSMTVKAYNAGGLASNTPSPLLGEQAVVDSTGKSQDVLRRIQVRVPLSDEYYWPEFGVQSMDTICKRFSSWPGGSEVTPPPSYLYNSGDPTSGGEENDSAKDKAACMLPGMADVSGWPN